MVEAIKHPVTWNLVVQKVRKKDLASRQVSIRKAHDHSRTVICEMALSCCPVGTLALLCKPQAHLVLSRS